MPWEDFKSRVLAYLDHNANEEVKLVSKMTGDSGRASHLDNAQTFSAVMEHLCQKASNARTRAVGLEVKNAVSDCLCRTTMTYHCRKAKRTTAAAKTKRGLAKMTFLQLQAMRILHSSKLTNSLRARFDVNFTADIAL